MQYDSWPLSSTSFLWREGTLTWAEPAASSWVPWCSSSYRWFWYWCGGWWLRVGWSSQWAGRSACWCFHHGREVQWSCTISHSGCWWTLKKPEADVVYARWLPDGTQVAGGHQGSCRGKTGNSVRKAPFATNSSLRRTKIRTMTSFFPGAEFSVFSLDRMPLGIARLTLIPLNRM